MVVEALLIMLLAGVYDDYSNRGSVSESKDGSSGDVPVETIEDGI